MPNNAVIHLSFTQFKKRVYIENCNNFAELKLFSFTKLTPTFVTQWRPSKKKLKNPVSLKKKQHTTEEVVCLYTWSGGSRGHNNSNLTLPQAGQMAPMASVTVATAAAYVGRAAATDKGSLSEVACAVICEWSRLWS